MTAHSAAPDKVVLCELPEDAAAYLDDCRSSRTDPSEPTVVSLEPRTHTYLVKNGVRCTDSRPYFDSAGHERGLRKSHELLTWLGGQATFEDGLGISEAYRNALLWYSRYFYNHLVWLADILAEVHSQHPDASIQTVAGKVGGSSGPRLGNDDRYIGLLAQSFCHDQGIPFQAIGPQSATPLPQTYKEAAWPKKLAYRLGAHLHRSALRRLGKARPVLTPVHANRMDVLVGQARKDLPDVPWMVFGTDGGSLSPMNLLRKAAKAVVPGMAGPASEPYLGEVWYQILERAASEDGAFVKGLDECLESIAGQADQGGSLFTHRQVNFGPMYASKLRSGIKPAVRKLHRQIKALDEVLDLAHPRAIVTPVGRRSLHALGELANQRGIPGLLISHGSFTPLKNELEEMAWKFHAHGLFHGSYSHAALQTPLAESFSNEVTSTAQYVKTGPLSWGIHCPRDAAQALKVQMLGADQDCRVVVHAGTGKARGSMHFHVYETLDEYVAAMGELVLAVDQVPDTFLILKFRPNADLGMEDLRTLLPASDRYMISVDESFLDVLGFTDLLVSFSSTTIEEALQNRVPVLLYGGDGRYQHIASQDISPEVGAEAGALYSVRKTEHLADGLKKILDCNGHAPLPEKLFESYAYRPEDYTSFPEVVRELTDGTANGIRTGVTG